VLRALHRAVERREVAHAERLVLRERRELQRQALRVRERALRADQQVREVVRPQFWSRAGLHHVDVVALHAAQDLRPPRRDLVGLAAHDRVQLRRERAVADRAGRDLVARAEAELGAVGEARVDRGHVVHHVAVADRARAARVVARHAADGGLRRGRHVHRKPEPVRAQERIQPVEHDAGLHRDRRARRIELDHLVQVLRMIDDQRRADRLTALRGAGAARQDRHARLERDLHRADRGGLGPGNHHADRLDLVDRRVGGVPPATRAVEQNLALDLALQPLCKTGVGCTGVEIEPVEVHSCGVA
jgi:hypothetical protein